MKTQDVLEALGRERKYQKKIGSSAKTVGEELLLMEEFLARARYRWLTLNSTVGPEQLRYHEIMNNLRRIAGNCVRIMEKHGVGDEK